MAENTEYPTADHIEAGVAQAEAEEETTEAEEETTEVAPEEAEQAPKDDADGGVPG